MESARVIIMKRNDEDAIIFIEQIVLKQDLPIKLQKTYTVNDWFRAKPNLNAPLREYESGQELPQMTWRPMI